MPFFRKIEEELEARLSSPDGRPGNARGKSERKTYGDGEERLKVKARDLDLTDGTPVQVVIGSKVVDEAIISKGRLRLDFTDSTRPVREVSPGDPIELRADGVVHLVGIYRPD